MVLVAEPDGVLRALVPGLPDRDGSGSGVMVTPRGAPLDPYVPDWVVDVMLCKWSHTKTRVKSFQYRFAARASGCKAMSGQWPYVKKYGWA